MNELLKINYETEQPTVSARDLHEKLEISKRFSVWFETNSKGFVEGQDYTSVLSGTVVNNGATRKIQDFNISTEMAKHICLMSRTEKGMQECALRIMLMNENNVAVDLSITDDGAYLSDFYALTEDMIPRTYDD